MEEIPLFDPSDLRALKAALPPNYLKLLGQRTRLSPSTISRFFRSASLRGKNALAIYDASLELIAEHQIEQAVRRKRMQQLIHHIDGPLPSGKTPA